MARRKGAAAAGGQGALPFDAEASLPAEVRRRYLTYALSVITSRALRGGLATLDLSDDQKAKIRTILESKRDAAQGLTLTMRTDAKALHDLAAAPNPDPAAVGAAFLKLKADRDAVRGAAEGVLGEIKGVLTSEQQTKLDGYLAALRQMRRARHGGN